MRTAFVSRLGGAGDVLHASHLPELIKKHFNIDHITWETNEWGMHVLINNPFIDRLEMIDTHRMTFNRMFKHLEEAQEKYDMVLDLSNTIEKEYCTNENDSRYYRPDRWRRENLGKISYYDVMTKAAGLPESFYGTRGHLWYSDEMHQKARAWIDKKHEQYDQVIVINLSGSTLHKKFIHAEAIGRRILEEYPRALLILTGDDACRSQLFEHERVLSHIDVKDNSFRQIALKVKYVDLTISLESGLALIAHSWDAPCLQLLTAASWDNHVKYAKNAYWLQAETPCSPCHRNPREFFGCPVKDRHPACIFFDHERVMEKVREALVPTLKPAQVAA